MIFRHGGAIMVADHKSSKGSELFFYYPVLDALSNGQVITKAVRIVLQVLGILVFLGGLLLVIQVVKSAVQAPGLEATLGALLLAVIILTALACVAQIHFYRARSVAELRSSPYTVISIASILFRAAGEIYATLGVAVGVGGCLFIWVTGFSPLNLLGGYSLLFRPAPSGGTLLSGAFFLVYALVGSFVVLALGYLLAESAIVMVDIAGNTRELAAGAGRSAAPEAPPPQPQQAIPPEPPRCPRCSVALPPGVKFCGACGASMG